MKGITIYFQGVMFFVDYEEDGEGCYAMHATATGHEWIESFSQKAEIEFNEKLNAAVKEQSTESEMERQLSDMEYEG